MSPKEFIQSVFCKGGNPKLIQGLVGPSPQTLPNWVFEEDVEYYVQYQKSGYTTMLNYYRALDL